MPQQNTCKRIKPSLFFPLTYEFAWLTGGHFDTTLLCILRLAAGLRRPTPCLVLILCTVFLNFLGYLQRIPWMRLTVRSRMLFCLHLYLN